MKLFLKIAVSAFILFILVGAGGIFFLSRGLDSAVNIEIDEVSLVNVEDGIYTGTYKGGRWSNELSITVKDKKITRIDVVKDVTFPKPEWTQSLFQNVMKHQNTNVDVISGATATSKAYLKAIENALK